MHRRQYLGVLATGAVGTAAYLGLGDDQSPRFSIRDFSMPSTITADSGFTYHVEIEHHREGEAEFEGALLARPSGLPVYTFRDEVSASFSGATRRNLHTGVHFDGDPGAYRFVLSSAGGAQSESRSVTVTTDG